MEKIYNKLVRDKMPDIITADGNVPIFRALSEDEYREELEKKLFEECKEVVEATDDNRVEELADVIEVIRALGESQNVTIEDIIKVADEKKLKRGAFIDKIFLEKVISE